MSNNFKERRSNQGKLIKLQIALSEDILSGNSDIGYSNGSDELKISFYVGVKNKVLELIIEKLES